MNKLAFAIVVLAASIVVAAPPPPVGEITLERQGDDLVLRWLPPPVAVDGYRVYRSEQADCGAETMIYEGSLAEYGAPSALADPTLGIYRVSAFVGAEESDKSPPVYKFEVIVPAATSPDANGLLLVSVPYVPALASSLDLCTDVNGGLGLGQPFGAIHRLLPQSAAFQTQACVQAVIRAYDLDARPYFFRGDTGAAEAAMIWGRAPEEWRIELAEPIEIFPTAGMPFWLYSVTLPYDHDYVDLAAVAADIPSALEVLLWDPDWNCNVTCSTPGMGLSRPTTADPWTGTNFDLTTRRGEGILIGVESPTTWIPRQHCNPTRLRAPRRITTLAASAAGSQVSVAWTLLPEAVGGYEIVHASTKAELTDPSSLPVVRELASDPALPLVVDPPAGASLVFYQVVVKDSAGEPGEY